MAVIGIGETDYYRHGASLDAEFKLPLKAILTACADAGIDPREIDGFASYSDDRSDASRLATTLGIYRLRSATMQWGGGGGSCCAAVAVLVELPQAGGVRMVGNLLGDPMEVVTIGAEVEGVFEHHPESDPPFSLLQWRTTPSTSAAEL